MWTLGIECRCSKTLRRCSCFSSWCSTATTAPNTRSAASGAIHRRPLRSLLSGSTAGADGELKTSTRQRLVFDAMRLHGLLAFAPLVVFRVLLVVPFEPHHLRVALE